MKFAVIRNIVVTISCKTKELGIFIETVSSAGVSLFSPKTHTFFNISVAFS